MAFVPLFWVIDRAETLRRAVLYGWLMGTVAHLIGFHWLVYTISVFGGFPYPLSGLIFVFYAILQGLQMAIFAFLVRRLGFGPLQIFPAVFWISLEFWFPLLFPWYVANSQVSFSWFIQTADLVGPYGASFLLMWFNAALFKLVCARQEERRAANSGVGLPGVARAAVARLRLPALTDGGRRNGLGAQIVSGRCAGKYRHRSKMEPSFGKAESREAQEFNQPVGSRAFGDLAGIGRLKCGCPTTCSICPKS